MQSQIRGGRVGGGPGSRQQEPSRRGAGGNYLTTTRAPGRRGTAGAERVEEEEEELSVATRTLCAVEPGGTEAKEIKWFWFASPKLKNEQKTENFLT